MTCEPKARQSPRALAARPNPHVAIGGTAALWAVRTAYRSSLLYSRLRRQWEGDYGPQANLSTGLPNVISMPTPRFSMRTLGGEVVEGRWGWSPFDRSWSEVFPGRSRCCTTFGVAPGSHLFSAQGRRRIDVRRAHADVGGQVVLGTPKSHQHRTVPIPSVI
jgi:hypothetical protein